MRECTAMDRVGGYGINLCPCCIMMHYDPTRVAINVTRRMNCIGISVRVVCRGCGLIGPRYWGIDNINTRKVAVNLWNESCFLLPEMYESTVVFDEI